MTKKTGKRSPTLGDVIRSAMGAVLAMPWCTPHKEKVLRYIASCGTGLLGWRVTICSECKQRDVTGLGCQSSYCPSCGAHKRAEWAEAREREIVDAPYFHFVFTVPGALYSTIYRHQRVMFGAMFQAAKETLMAMAANPRFLGGTPPIFAVLHTTNQKLQFHPHIHVIIAGVGIDRDTGRRVEAKNPTFLFPARALASGFRGRLIKRVRQLLKMGALQTDRQRKKNLYNSLSAAFRINWQVHTKHATAGPRAAIRYLARYTYRTAISNQRILALKDGNVTFTWKDRKAKRRRTTTLPAIEFITLFQKHILPKRMRSVRFWGALAPNNKKRMLKLLRAGRPSKTQEPNQQYEHQCCNCQSTLLHMAPYPLKMPARIPNTLPIPPPELLWPDRQESPWK